MLTTHTGTRVFAPQGAMLDETSGPNIDISLARAIRRAYFRALSREWNALAEARIQAKRRNMSIMRPVESEKQLRERFQQLERMVGHLIPCTSARLNANSRSAAVILGLQPDPVPALPNADSAARLIALTLLRPGHFLEYEIKVKVSGHAVDRVIQRTRIVDLPVRGADIQAINAEFSDALPLACIAASILNDLAHKEGADAARELQVLLPSEHGVFLGGWSPEDKELIIRTFVDNAKLTGPQLEAMGEIAQWADGELSAQVLTTLTAGWMNLGVTGLKERLLDTWRQYGWRFDEQRLHPGLSDKAWATPH